MIEYSSLKRFFWGDEIEEIANIQPSVNLLLHKYNYEKKAKTVMVKNSTNINNTNKHLSPQMVGHYSQVHYNMVT